MKTHPPSLIEAAPSFPVPAASAPEAHPPRECEAIAASRPTDDHALGPSGLREQLLETYRLWALTGR